MSKCRGSIKKQVVFVTKHFAPTSDGYRTDKRRIEERAHGCREFQTNVSTLPRQALENAEDAEDLIQEAYLKLWSKREELTLISNPEAFAVTLVKNMCFDLLRSGKYLSDRQHLPLTEAQNALPADGRDAKDDAQLVRMLIARLPQQQRMVMMLRDVKGCSYEEVERLTGLNAVNVRVLLSRARKKIREEFTKWNNYESR